MYISHINLNLNQDGRFSGCSQIVGPKRGLLPKIRHAYPTMMKLGTITPYLKEIQKHINHGTHRLNSADITTFSPEISNFCYIKKYRYRFHFNT